MPEHRQRDDESMPLQYGRIHFQSGRMHALTPRRDLFRGRFRPRAIGGQEVVHGIGDPLSLPDWSRTDPSRFRRTRHEYIQIFQKRFPLQFVQMHDDLLQPRLQFWSQRPHGLAFVALVLLQPFGRINWLCDLDPDGTAKAVFLFVVQAEHDNLQSLGSIDNRLHRHARGAGTDHLYLSFICRLSLGKDTQRAPLTQHV